MLNAGSSRAKVIALLAALMLLTPWARAHVCQAELRDVVTEEALSAAPTGIDAALVLKRAVELVEPALPPFDRSLEAPLPKDHPNYAAIKYLSERELLPAAWQPEELDGPTWSVMLSTFLSWYQLPPVTLKAPETVGGLMVDASMMLTEISGAIRPAALLAIDPKRGRRPSFFGIIWNWTAYPRLLVFRPGEEDPADPASVMALLSNCAVHVNAYISAPQETATRLFLANNKSRMYVVGSQPESDTMWPIEVPAGAELGAFNYTLADLDTVELYAAVFDGPSVGMGTLLAMLPRIRTNISPFSLTYYLETP